MDINTQEKEKRRKRGEGRKQEERKKLRSAGMPYTTKKNKQIPGKRSAAREVSCKCKLKCSILSHEQKKRLFDDFYGLKDTCKQNSYAMSLVHIGSVKRRRHGTYGDPAESRRQTSVTYTLPDGKGEIRQVCQRFLCEVFAISKRRVTTIVNYKTNGGMIYVEGRGNKTVHRKYTEEDEEKVKEHINKFPREESHYTRAKNMNKQYLSPDLSRYRLWKDFLQKSPNFSHIPYRFYCQVFQKHFPDLKFHQPRHDTCSTCDLFHNQLRSDPNNRAIKRDRELHHRTVERALQKMKSDGADSQEPGSSICTAAMDLQKVLSLPTLTHGDMYYMRQLSNYNLGIHIADNDTGHMFLWHEAMCGRGGNEIASCVYKAFTSGITTKQDVLNMWSDNCCSQNKNKMILFVWMYLVSKGVFKEINHKYLVKGHSFMSCDRDFSHIERRKHRASCEVPTDLANVIITATRKPFQVTLMTESDFFDFKAAAEKLINTSNLHITAARWIQIRSDRPGVVLVRKYLNEIAPWKEVWVMKKHIRPSMIAEVDLPLLSCTNRVTTEKKTDLRAMIPYLKAENREFYEDLLK